MKRVFRHFVIDTFSLWTISQIASGMVFSRGIITLIIAGVGVTITSLLAKPVINILLLPINLITFGFFRWVSSAVILFIVTLVVKDFKINFFAFGGLASKWIDIPPINLSGVLAIVAFSFILSIISSFIYWLIK